MLQLRGLGSGIKGSGLGNGVGPVKVCCKVLLSPGGCQYIGIVIGTTKGGVNVHTVYKLAVECIVTQLRKMKRSLVYKLCKLLKTHMCRYNR